MSTPNFALKSASRYFVFGTPVYYTQEDIEEYGMDPDLLGEYDEEGTELSFQAAKDNVYYELLKKGWHGIEEFDSNRNSPTCFFAEKTKTISLANVDIDITIKAGSTAGYYQAANFDWFTSIKVYGLIDGWNNQLEYEANELKEEDVIRGNWYDNKGLSKIHAEHLIKKIASIIDELKNEAELAFSMYCDEEMYCAYMCGNGEAGYSTAGKRLWQEIEEKNKKTA